MVYNAHYCSTNKVMRIIYVYGREMRITSLCGFWNHTAHRLCDTGCGSCAWNYLPCFAACRHTRQFRFLCSHFYRNAYMAQCLLYCVYGLSRIQSRLPSSRQTSLGAPLVKFWVFVVTIQRVYCIWMRGLLFNSYYAITG